MSGGARRPVAGAAAPTKAEARAAAQRERILAAARQCFIERGFHGASMASIAQTAGMSPGLMYRYFPSKNAIVLEIIARQLEHSRLRIRELRGSSDLPAAIIQSFRKWREGDPATMHGALFLETSAEGSRDAQIGAALRSADRQTRADLQSWFDEDPRRRAGQRVKQDRESRLILLQCLMEGLAIRLIREPDIELEEIEPALRELTDQLLGS